MSKRIFLQPVVERRGGIRKGLRFFDARLGALSSTAKTEADAIANIQAQVEARINESFHPYLMLDLQESGTVWIARFFPEGWGYDILRPSKIKQWELQGGSVGGSWTRDECIAHMQKHWWDLNMMGVVNGILGLCTNIREWVCKRCFCVSASAAPYRCTNPACGDIPETSTWF